jgi:hypothetical protein
MTPNIKTTLTLIALYGANLLRLFHIILFQVIQYALKLDYFISN